MHESLFAESNKFTNTAVFSCRKTALMLTAFYCVPTRFTVSWRTIICVYISVKGTYYSINVLFIHECLNKYVLCKPMLGSGWALRIKHVKLCNA